MSPQKLDHSFPCFVSFGAIIVLGRKRLADYSATQRWQLLRTRFSTNLFCSMRIFKVFGSVNTTSESMTNRYWQCLERQYSLLKNNKSVNHNACLARLCCIPSTKLWLLEMQFSLQKKQKRVFGNHALFSINELILFKFGCLVEY